MNDDHEFKVYQDAVEFYVSDDYLDRVVGDLQASDKPREAPRFRKDPKTGTWQPVAYAGYTLISPQFREEPDSVMRYAGRIALDHSRRFDHALSVFLLNIRTYTALADLQAGLLGSLSDANFAPVPPSSFHVTIADLISGDDMKNIRTTGSYRAKELRTQETQDFLRIMHSLDRDNAVTEIASPYSVAYGIRTFSLFETAIRLGVRGLTLFGPVGAVAPVVAVAKIHGNTNDEDAYSQIMRVRELIYGDTTLKNLGVVRKHAFLAHVTLGYVEADPDPDLRARVCAKLRQVIKDTNEHKLSEPLPLVVYRAELREFDDLSTYREP